ncbi:MAG: 2-isopropylmalate synthase [Clostridia bacterium]|jgi:2-isopropylmalate synthase|nr:2-isopropylmalate synthase [Clostridia bacterium]
MRKIFVFDTTLRDGEQSPGVSLNVKEKVAIAKQLAKLGVDCIEAGFPIASEGDFEAVKAIAQSVRGPIIAALARTNEADIRRAWEALQYAEKPRIHTFIATSNIHMVHKLKKTPQEVLKSAVEGVKLAKSFTPDVEFSAEDGFRSDLDFLCEILEAVIEAGATTVNIPDTVGYATPREYGEFIKAVRERVPNIEKAVISVHCHNDLGLAVANTLAALEAGATQVEVAMNGIGERAGNASLEEVVMAIHTRRNYLKMETNITTEEIYRTSRMVSTLTGMPIQHNKAVVGRNAFIHESGIHQDGVLKERETYEIMNPAMIGRGEDNIYLGKHSGRHAFKLQLKTLGYEIEGEALDKAFARFKSLCDKKTKISDEDLIALVDTEVLKGPETYKFSHIHFTSGTNINPTSTIGVVVNGELQEVAACAKGPVEATYQAINNIVGEEIVLEDYIINSLTPGRDAQGEVVVRISYKGRSVTGRGLSVDIIEASARAYLNAINKGINLAKTVQKSQIENSKVEMG